MRVLLLCVFYSVLCLWCVCVASSGWEISGAMNCVCPSIVVCVWKAVEKVEEEEGGGTEKRPVCVCVPLLLAKGVWRSKMLQCVVMAMRDEMKRRKARERRERERGRGGAASACVL